MRKHLLLSVLALSLLGCSESENKTSVAVESASTESTQTSDESPKEDEKIGEFTKNSSTMPINGQYAIWDEAENKLSVFLTPTKLDNEEKTKLEEGEPDFFIFSRKDSPDKSQWQWYPYVVAEISFESADINRENTKSVYIKAYGIEKKNHTDNLNLSSSDLGDLEKIDFGEEGLSMKYSGTSSIMDNRFHWDIEN
ncbi:MAG: hypothetical protein ACQES2_08150 [Pseudomonadota bacterium]